MEDKPDYTQQKIKQPVMTQKAQGQNNPIILILQSSIEVLSQQIKHLLCQQQQANQIQINGKIKSLIKLQTKFHSIKQLYLERNQGQEKENQLKNEQKQLKERIQLIQKESDLYQPTMEDITDKKDSMQEEMNDDGWTDATQSQTGTLGQDGIMVLDDDMLDQLIGKMNDKADEQSQSQQQQDRIDLDELEQQFVTGQQSNEDFLYGKHSDKFCVSVCSFLKQGIVVSGGGDDKLHLYKVTQNEQNQGQTKSQAQVKEQQPKEQEGEMKQKQVSKSILVEPFKIIPHSQTIDRVDLSFDKQNLFSLTQKQLLCTNLKTFETTKIDIDPPSQIVCHRQGGVFAIANAFNVEIFNIKGFKFYDSYCLDQQINILKWTSSGKQLVAACDNKLRIITPKTRQVTKVTGTAFHDGQITVMSLAQNTVYTGCIDGMVFASNLTKGQILGGIPKLQATINTLCAAENYLIVGPALSSIYWYDSNKLKHLFTNELKGSSTDIIELANRNQYAVSDIQGQIHLFDKRSPMKEKFLLKAGNTVHQLWYEDNTLLAACQDGCVRGWDLRKYAY